MIERNRVALHLALAALLLGAFGDLLLRYVPWGVNALLWSALFCVAALRSGALTNRLTAPVTAPDAEASPASDPPQPRRNQTTTWFAAACAVILSACLAWRTAEVLIALDVFLLLFFLAMLALDARGVRAHAAGLAEIAGGLLLTAGQSVAGFPQLIVSDLSWTRVPRRGFHGAGVAVRGTMIATPALLVFGSLLTSADDRFAKLLHDVFAFDAEELVLHVVVTLVIGAICAGFLRSVAFSSALPRVDRPAFLSLPAAETNFALGLLNLLFAAFVAVQFRYFFGAAPATLAQYARSGFFELVWVVALVVPMLLLLDWLIDQRHGATLFRGLAAMQVALVFVIAASAYRRMQLYRDAFGLTRLRLYTTAFMLWVAVLLVWLAVTVLTGRRRRFAIGALASAVITVVTLHALNPDALIVRTNLDRAHAGQRAFDGHYAANLSDDAAEVILANPTAFPAADLTHYLQRPRSIGWRTWNLSRARAIRVVHGALDEGDGREASGGPAGPAARVVPTNRVR